MKIYVNLFFFLFRPSDMIMKHSFIPIPLFLIIYCDGIAESVILVSTSSTHTPLHPVLHHHKKNYIASFPGTLVLVGFGKKHASAINFSYIARSAHKAIPFSGICFLVPVLSFLPFYITLPFRRGHNKTFITRAFLFTVDGR